MTSVPSGSATRERSRVALVTSDYFPDLYADDHPLRDALRARGVVVDAVCWDDPGADWTAYDLAVLRSTWDYPPRHDAFLAWARSVPGLANPADIVEWNTDKHYLRELAASGVPVTPTRFVEPGEQWTAPAAGEWVVKPAVSIGSRDSGRYRLPGQRELAEAHVARLGAAGRTAMIQPYLAAVDTVGETAVLCLPDKTGAMRYSHAIRKDALLHGPDVGLDPRQYRQEITSREAGDAELAVAERALAAVPGGADRLLYARVDTIPGPDGRPLLVELELVEPTLFLLYDEGAADRLADAVLDRLPRS
ncbi:ATP-grasp domain-containing protein [Krasilnikovia sp. M28-CT-15]|uniref:ATP-grasp domain-containing protein n=1 Tax=Krasilnikovia sp. M28-CT-15 TaxID=3373540 RepID=UPI003875C59E